MRFNLRPRLSAFAAMAGAALPVSSAWNPLDKGANITLSNSDRTATKSSGASDEIVRGTLGRGSGLYKFEILVNAISSNRPFIGISELGASASGFGGTGTSVRYDRAGNVTINSTVVATLDAYVDGDTLSFELNRTANQLFIQKAGGTRSSAISVSAVTFYPTAVELGSGNTATINTGQAAFVIPMTSGWTAWG